MSVTRIPDECGTYSRWVSYVYFLPVLRSCDNFHCLQAYDLLNWKICSVLERKLCSELLFWNKNYTGLVKHE